MLLRVCFAPGAAALARENIKGADTSINTGSRPGELLVMEIYFVFICDLILLKAEVSINILFALFKVDYDTFLVPSLQNAI